ncbi:scavenger receptor class B member 1 [Anabrus simplex]|uniref:scavenger receptor class B member 1 n=1 Tax=Anabrus simplex TaxID=316456 RepID=UPI0035A37106
MKDFLSIFGFVSPKSYNAVNTNGSNVHNETTESIDLQQRRRSKRSGSVVVNRFFHETVLLEKRRHSRCAVFLMLMGVLAIGTGSFILLADPYDMLLKWKLTLSDGGETYEIWRKPSADLVLRVYLFNITNKDEFLSGKEKLKVQEVGPYVYRENLEHANVTFNDNGTLNSIPKHPLVWAPELSNGTEEDLLILPNIALLSIASVVKDKSYFTRLGMNLLIRQTDSHPLVEMTAKEFMFGYETALTTLGNTVLPSWIFFDKIGLIARMYDFNGDTSTVYTGETDVRKSGLFETYRGSKHLPHWYRNREECSRVSSVDGASDATKFPSLIQPDDNITMFRKSLCRTMPMEKVGEAVMDGFTVYNYTWKEGILDNGLYNPENKCFCREGHCLPEGLIDVADCYYGFPIALSYPHFYKADPKLVEDVEGSFPNKEKHETRFLINPVAGLPINLDVRMQINMAFGDISAISRVGRFSHMVLPMLWTEISLAKLPDDLLTKFNIYLNITPVFFSAMVYVTLICGPLLLIGSIMRVFCKTWEERRDTDIEGDMNYSKKHMKYINTDGKSSLKNKEVDMYFSSLLMPRSGSSPRDTIVRCPPADVDIV